jgi:very-short-patch-repair endonuclease
MSGFIKTTVQKLRKNPTETEKIIWEVVRDRRLSGYKFLRQHSIRFNYYGKIRFFVADFYVAELKLVIEIDGKIHKNQQEYDQYRTFIINQLGMRVVRITNDDIKDSTQLAQHLAELLF